MTLTAFSRDNIPHQGKDLIHPCFPVRTESPIRGRQVDYLQYRLQTPNESNSCGRFVHRKILTTIDREPSHGKKRGIPHLEVILDDVEDEIPMRSWYMLEDWRKVEKQNSHMTFHLFFDVLVRGHPVLTRFHEIDCPRLGNENDV